MNIWGHSLNKQARKALEKLHLHIHPKQLPVLQLMAWGLEEGGLAADPAVEETTWAMFRWKPEAAMNYLTGQNPEEGTEHPLPPEDLTDPEQLAAELLALLEISESAHNPSYRGASL